MSMWPIAAPERVGHNVVDSPKQLTGIKGIQLRAKLIIWPQSAYPRCAPRPSATRHAPRSSSSVATIECGMDAWIIRLPEHPPIGFGGSRPVVVLHVSVEGEETELEVLRIGSWHPDLGEVIQDEIDKGHSLTS